MNPRLLPNNLLVPYVIAVWEEYFRCDLRGGAQVFDSATIRIEKREAESQRQRGNISCRSAE